MLLRHPEQLSDELGPVTQVLLDELGAHHSQEGRRGLVGNGLGQQGLTFRGRKIAAYILQRGPGKSPRNLKSDSTWHGQQGSAFTPSLPLEQNLSRILSKDVRIAKTGDKLNWCFF